MAAARKSFGLNSSQSTFQDELPSCYERYNRATNFSLRLGSQDEDQSNNNQEDDASISESSSFLLSSIPTTVIFDNNQKSSISLSLCGIRSFNDSILSLLQDDYDEDTARLLMFPPPNHIHPVLPEVAPDSAPNAPVRNASNSSNDIPPMLSLLMQAAITNRDQNCYKKCSNTPAGGGTVTAAAVLPPSLPNRRVSSTISTHTFTTNPPTTITTKDTYRSLSYPEFSSPPALPRREITMGAGGFEECSNTNCLGKHQSAASSASAKTVSRQSNLNDNENDSTDSYVAADILPPALPRRQVTWSQPHSSVSPSSPTPTTGSSSSSAAATAIATMSSCG